MTFAAPLNYNPSSRPRTCKRSCGGALISQATTAEPASGLCITPRSRALHLALRGRFPQVPRESQLPFPVPPNQLDAETRGGDSSRKRRAMAKSGRSKRLKTRHHREAEWLAEGRGEVGEGEKGGINFFDKGTVGFGLGFDALPFGIVAERLPVGGGGFAAGVREHVDESLALERIVGREPVGDVFDVVLFEERHGVVAEARQESVEFAFVGVVDAEFVDGGGGLRERRERREESGGGEGLQKLAAIHGGRL